MVVRYFEDARQVGRIGDLWSAAARKQAADREEERGCRVGWLGGDEGGGRITRDEGFWGVVVGFGWIGWYSRGPRLVRACYGGGVSGGKGWKRGWGLGVLEKERAQRAGTSRVQQGVQLLRGQKWGRCRRRRRCRSRGR